MMVESDGTLRNSLLEPSKFQIVEESGKKYFISSTHVVRIPTKYNLVPAGTQPASGFDTKEKSDSSKHRIFIKSEGSNEVGVYEKVGTSSSSQPKTTTDSEVKKESTSNTNSSLTEEQSEALAKGMKTFGEKMGQVPYEKTDVPGKLTWQSGGDLEGYKVYESYIYKSGGTTHRYFFTANSNGTPEVLYSTGGTSVKNTANADIVAMFKEVYGGGSSDREEKNEIKSTTSANNNSHTGVYRAKNGDEVILQEDGTLKVSKLNRTLVSRSNSNGSISFAPTNDYNSPANVSMYHLIPANQPVSDKMYSDIDDSSKDRIIFSMPGGMPESAREIYFKVNGAPEKKEEKTTNKSSKSKLDIDAIARGDLSSAAGIYDVQGGSIIIENNKIFAMNNSNKESTKISRPTKLGEVATMWVAPETNNGFDTGAVMYIFVPAGESNPYLESDKVDTSKLLPETDINRDRVIIYSKGKANSFYLN